MHALFKIRATRLVGLVGKRSWYDNYLLHSVKTLLLSEMRAFSIDEQSRFIIRLWITVTRIIWN